MLCRDQPLRAASALPWHHQQACSPAELRQHLEPVPVPSDGAHRDLVTDLAVDVGNRLT